MEKGANLLLLNSEIANITYYYFYFNGKLLSLFLPSIECLWNVDARRYLYICVTAKKTNFPERFRKKSEYGETPS